MPTNLLTSPRARQAVVEVLLCSLIWGFGFVAVRWALPACGPFTLSAIRFFGAAALAAPCFLFSARLRRAASAAQFRLSVLPGLLLGLTLLLQTYGIKYSTVSRCGFLTCLYVVLVPIFQRLRSHDRKTRLSPLQLGFIGIALLGAALICDFEVSGWNRGDLATIGCACAAALQILSLEKIGARIDSPFAFNTMQSLWSGLLALPFALALEPLPHWPPPTVLAGVGIFVLTVFSTLVGFMLQVRAQRVLPAALISMLFLIEAPAAAAFAFAILGEAFSALQWGGAVLILGAAAGTIVVHQEPEISVGTSRGV